MAIAYAHMGFVQRSRGGNAVRQALYNAREAGQSERTRESWDWTHKRASLEHHEILLPEGAQAYLDPARFWSAVEFAENRKDSVTAREIILALPKDAEITREDRIELVRTFVEEYFVSKGLAVQINLHTRHFGPDGQWENPHSHVLVTTRRLEGDRFAPTKARDLDNEVRRVGRRNLVMEGDLWGQRWGEHQDRYFAARGLEIRVDPVAIVPGKHLGPGHVHNPASERSLQAEAIKAANHELARDPRVVAEHLRDQMRPVLSARQPPDPFAAALLSTIKHALDKSIADAPDERTRRLIEGVDRAIFIYGGETVSPLAKSLLRVATIASGADNPERMLVEGTREAIRRHEARSDPRYGPGPEPEGLPPTSLGLLPPIRPFLIKHGIAAEELEPLARKVLEQQGWADHVPSGLRKLTVDDLARQMSPEYARLSKLRGEIAKDISGKERKRQALHDRLGDMRGDFQDRRNRIGSIRTRLDKMGGRLEEHLGRRGKHSLVVRVLRDQKLDNIEDWGRAIRYSYERSGIKLEALRHQLLTVERRAATELEKIRPEAETQLARRSEIAKQARATLDVSRGIRVKRSRGYSRAPPH